MELRELVHELISISVIHRCRIAKSASGAGLYFGQPQILEYVTEHNNCTQKDIAAAMHISPPSAAVSLKRIEKAGLITRTTDKSDSRKNLISITEKGRIALAEFRKICDTTDKEMFRNFTEEDMEALHSLLLRLHENLDSKSYTKEEISKILCDKGERK